MKKIIILTYITIFGLFICAFNEVKAQQNGPEFAVPYGKGTGKTGFDFSTPPNYGALFAGTDNVTAPAFLNIIRGQNYNSPMTGATGEVYGYSFRNSTTSASDIYDPINVTPINNQNGIESVLSVPSTATADGAIGIAAYVKNASTAGVVNTVGLFAAGMGTVANAPVWGINTLLMDNATRATHSRTGQILIGYEADFNVMGSNTQVLGMSIGGNSLSSPSAASLGYVCNSLNGATVPIVYKWPVCFITQDGVADVAFVAGSSAASGTNVPSQPIWMLYHDTGGVRKLATFRAGPTTPGFGGFQMYTDDTETALEVGFSGSSRGRLILAGSISGVTYLDTQAASSGALVLPNAIGTLVATASSPLSIDATTGNLSWTGLTQYGVIYANATTGVASTAAGTSTTVLHGNASGAPTWSAVSLTADITGTLGVGNGGTGITSGTSGGIPCYTGSTTIASSAALTANAIVKGGGAGACPTASGVYIDSSDNVGIGTAAPNSRLSIALGANTTNYKTYTNNDQAQFNYYAAQNEPSSNQYFRSLDIVSAGGNTQSVIRFINQITSDGNPTETMRINELGKVGIGTTSPVNKLDVTGSFGRGAPVTKVDDFTLAATENWIICDKAGTVTVVLPAASLWTGREVTLKTIQAQTVVSASSDVVPLAGGSAGTAILAATAGKWATLVSNGTNWVIMQGN